MNNTAITKEELDMLMQGAMQAIQDGKDIIPFCINYMEDHGYKWDESYESFITKQYLGM